MEPQTGIYRHRIANATLALVLAAGCFYAVAAPQPYLDSAQAGPDMKRGPSRTSAVDGNVSVRAPSPETSAHAEATVKVIGAATDGEKPCDEQTWPYIDKRCLTIASDKPALPTRDSGSTPLGLRDLIAGVRPAPSAPQAVGNVTAAAPAPSARDMQASTVGVRATDEVVAAYRAAPDENADVPLPQPRPEVTLAAYSTRGEPDSVDVTATPAPMSQAEHRRMQREQRRAAREMIREQRRHELAERRAAKSSRIVRRWTEYSYDDDSRVVVIHQGSRRDRFFQSYR